MRKPVMKNHIVRVPDQLWDEAMAIATKRGDNLSELIRAALRTYVERNRSE